jgi:UDP-N-acetylglucosamine--N-acetylmuramyl-(pentapeptide) pyrophosphoryl-undecaprenol N-acetylglucosamine transferase
MIMAAGTGGHIFPGLAIAQALQQRGWNVTWLGTTHGMEREIVAKHQIELDMLDFSGMRGKGWRHTVSGAMKLLVGCWRSFQYLGQRRPDVVLGMGGYVTVPGGLMAYLRGIPLVLMNADAAWLLSNRLLARFAKRVLLGFPLNGKVALHKMQVTGNPVRDEIAQLPAPVERFANRSGPLRLLVLGGSLGAKVLNDALPAALALMPHEARPIVTHQSGQQHIAVLKAAYEQAQVDAHVLPFIEDMASHYAKADLVICRSGAITVTELAAAGVASVLTPLRVSSTTHQSCNAVWMAQHHAAIHLPQIELTPEKLAQLLLGMRRADCLKLAQAAYQLGQRQANQVIVSVLEQFCSDESSFPIEGEG